MPPSRTQDATGVRLTVAIGRLRARLRAESGTDTTGLSISQLGILNRLLDGPSTAAALASAEHVSQQAIAQSLATLKAAGLVRSKPDPLDGRRILISATPAGHRMVDAIVVSRDAWLRRAIDASLDSGERATLERAIGLLERLADTRSS